MSADIDVISRWLVAEDAGEEDILGVGRVTDHGSAFIQHELAIWRRPHDLDPIAPWSVPNRLTYLT